VFCWGCSCSCLEEVAVAIAIAPGGSAARTPGSSAGLTRLAGSAAASASTCLERVVAVAAAPGGTAGSAGGSAAAATSFQRGGSCKTESCWCAAHLFLFYRAIFVGVGGSKIKLTATTTTHNPQLTTRNSQLTTNRIFTTQITTNGNHYPTSG
jgi:3-oxoacyl-ACP reductase-like protein